MEKKDPSEEERTKGWLGRRWAVREGVGIQTAIVGLCKDFGGFWIDMILLIYLFFYARIYCWERVKNRISETN